MSDIHIVNDYPHAPAKVWRALIDPALIPLWTSQGRGGRPEGFSTAVGTRFKFVAKPQPGWSGVVECQVTEAREPSLLRYTWAADGGQVTQVTYRLEAQGSGTRFTFDHTGFTGVGGFLVAKLALGPVRRKMLGVGLRAVLDNLDDDGKLRPGSTPEPRP